jgi:hypothetical protein
MTAMETAHVGCMEEFLACLTISSSQSIGLCLAHPSELPVPFQLDQSKSTYAHPFVDCGSVEPLELQGMMIVDLFIWYVGVHVGIIVGTVVQPLWLHPGGNWPGGGKTELAGAGLQELGPGLHGGGVGGGGVQPGGLTLESIAHAFQSLFGTADQLVRL